MTHLSRSLLAAACAAALLSCADARPTRPAPVGPPGDAPPAAAPVRQLPAPDDQPAERLRADPEANAPAAAGAPGASTPEEPGRSAGATRTAAAVSAAAAASAYHAHQAFLGSGMRGPNGLALDAAGNLYEADFFRGTVTRVAPNGAVSPYAAGIQGPAGLAFDRAGHLLVAAYNGHTLEKVPPGGGSHATFAKTSLKRPVWPAVDSHGAIYLADYANNRIAKVDAQGAVSTFAALSGVNAIAIDPQDTLWVCTWGGRVLHYDAAGKGTQLAAGLPTACGIAWSPSYLALVTYGGERSHDGKLYLIDYAGKSHPVADQLDRASSVIFDRQMNVYTANCGDTALRKYALQ